MKGRGSRALKEGMLRELLLRSSPLKVKYLVNVVIGEMRHGMSDGVLEAIAQGEGVNVVVVRRANMLWGDLCEVGQKALISSEEYLRRASLMLFRPLKPMLAQTVRDLSEVFDRYSSQVALAYKLDGARVQIHRQQEQVRVCSP